MARKSIYLDRLLAVLPTWSSSRWLYPFEIAARDPSLKTPSLHDVLRRACDEQGVAARRFEKSTGKFQYARAKRGRR
jgi:hypothetical protein